ncbi:subclass B3 metallo-beta-lactamase [Massilia endophytica]|uniref:subclass B3 metallo-beta-lactamase n=1 Tax=Massilia endophytica TaxID=2899220 RepID=UPI001E3F76DD|nr:subclass B3 metallo-beta-lactamase [Massilia endophytica]UGQ48254.1 subclass B3 metallo-beta-lactamase [Massilia endophytica]
MKTTNAITAAVLLAMSASAFAGWDDPQEPFKLHGNSYYVGPRGVSSVLITSPAGHILIDAGTAKSHEQIIPHIRQLGFKVEDIKYILTSHEHHDHVGSIAALQRASGAVVVGSPLSVAVMKTGEASKDDPQFGDLGKFEPAAATRVVKDGETISLGALAVTAHYTPGHTPGGVSWTWQSSEAGRTVNLVYADSLTAYGAPGYRFSSHPEVVASIQRSVARVAALKCDVLVTAHPEAGDLWTRKEKGSLIDPEACRKYAAKGSARLEQVLAEEKAKP